MQLELASKIQSETKLNNIEFVSEEQYQREVTLLRENLKVEFDRSTNDLLSTLSSQGDVTGLAGGRRERD